MSQSYRKNVVDFIDKHALAIFVAFFLVAVALLGRSVYRLWTRPVRHRDSWNVPEPEIIPIEMVKARSVAAAIAKEEANWADEMETLSTLIETERPGEFHLGKEIVTNAALKDYVGKLLEAGEEAVRTFGRMTIAARNLEGLLAQAPQRYRANAALQRRYAEQETHQDLKDEYVTVADIWEAKALAAEKHRGDIREHLNTDLLGYLRARNLFLERLLTTLNNGLAANDLREAAEFRGRLQELVVKHEFLRKKLDEWRARLRGEPPAGPQPEPQKSEATSGSKNVNRAPKSEHETGAEPPAPSPRVIRAVMSSPGPAPSPPATLCYWDQVLEREMHWEGEVNRLLKIVEQLRPAQGIPDCGGTHSSLIPVRVNGVEIYVERWRVDEETANALRVHAEKVIGAGTHVELGLVGMVKAGRELGDLLEQTPAVDRPFGPLPPAESEIRWAVDTLRRRTGREAEAAAILRRLVGRDLNLFSGFFRDLREQTRSLIAQKNRTDYPQGYRSWAPAEFTEALLRVVETHKAIEARLRAMRAELLAPLPRDEPDRPTHEEPVVPQPPQAEPVPVQPTIRQASYQLASAPAWPPARAGHDRPPPRQYDPAWGDDDAWGYAHLRHYGAFPPLSLQVTSPPRPAP